EPPLRTIASASLFVLLLPVSFAGAQPADLDARVAKIVESVSEARLTEILKKLESFGTRHTLSNPETPGRGVGAARQWILEEMQRSSPRLQVGFDTYQVPKQGDRMPRDFELRNVMAVLPGKSPRRLYVSGHYDSVSRRPRAPGSTPAPTATDAPAQSASGGFDWTVTDNPAPGVNDDGSGTALTMELARAFGQ